MIPGSRTRCRWVQLLMQPREESVRGCVATVQFSRAVREGYARIAGTMAGDGRRGLSKLNSMHGLELGVMPRWPGQVRSTC